MLVALFFDFFADFLPFYPRKFNPDVSGILTIKKLVRREQRLSGSSGIEEQERRLRRGSMAGLPHA